MTDTSTRTAAQRAAQRAAVRGRQRQALLRHLRTAAALLRANGYKIEAPNLDAALLIEARSFDKAPAGSAHGAPDHRED